MKKRFLAMCLALVMCLALLPVAALAEDAPERGVLSYSEHIKPQYEDALLFSEDLAAVKKDGKWGYIDHDNKVVIPFQYELAYSFNEGKAVVAKSKASKDGETLYELGFIDDEGKYTPFMATVYDNSGKPTSRTEKLKASVPAAGRSERFLFHNGYVLIDDKLFRPDGSMVVLGGGDYHPTGPVNEGLVPVRHGKEETSNELGAGWADPATGEVVKFLREQDEYPQGRGHVNYTDSFNQGLAPVSVWVWTDDYSNGSYLIGFMDRNFRWALQPIDASIGWLEGPYTAYQVFGEIGLAIMRNAEKKCGAIDKTGKTVIPFQYEDLLPVSEGIISFKENGKYGYLDATDLSVVIPAQYENATSFNDGLAVVYDGSKAFLIDWKGNPVPGTDQLDPSTYFVRDEDNKVRLLPSPEEYLVIEENGKYGYGRIEYLPNLPSEEEMSNWAYDEVVSAIEEDLVPVYLQNLYQNDIKREEFCDLTMQAVTEILDVSAEELVQQRTGKALSAWVGEYPFIDSSNSNVIAAYALGIINGRGDGTFDPYATITRQEAAALLTRGAKVLGLDTTVTTQTSYADGAAVAGWAKDSVDFVAQANVMNGTGEGKFTPTGTYSREQSFITIYRLFHRIVEQQ